MKIKNLNKSQFKIICDFDGTISKNDTIDQFLERYATHEWQDIERDWKNGKIGTAECMQQQLSLVKISKKELDEWLSHIQIDINFIQFVRFCEKLNIPVSIASDGLDYFIKKIMSNYNLDRIKVSSNKLIFTSKDRITLETQKKLSLCDSKSMVCKCSVATEAKEDGSKVLFVGDGQSDYCVSKKIDLVVAKGDLLAYCKKHTLTHYNFDDFKDVQNIVKYICRKPDTVAFRTDKQIEKNNKSLNS